LRDSSGNDYTVIIFFEHLCGKEAWVNIICKKN